MKTLMLSLAAILLGAMISNAQSKMSNHVVTKTDTIFCGKMKVGCFKTKCSLGDGKKIKIANSHIVRYSNNGRLYQRKPVYLNNKKTGRLELMEIVKVKNGVIVYKDEHFNGVKHCLDANFYFYKNGKCINIQRNPDVDQIMAYLNTFRKQDDDSLKERNLTRQ